MKKFLSSMFVAAVACLVVGCPPPEPPVCDANLIHLTGPGSPFWYPATNPLMQAISASPTIAPNNAAIMSRQLTMIGGTAAKPVIALYDWARPVYYVGSADPKTTNVRLTALGNGTG